MNIGKSLSSTIYFYQKKPDSVDCLQIKHHQAPLRKIKIILLLSNKQNTQRFFTAVIGDRTPGGGFQHLIKLLQLRHLCLRRRNRLGPALSMGHKNTVATNIAAPRGVLEEGAVRADAVAERNVDVEVCHGEKSRGVPLPGPCIIEISSD